jgi:hypothetical protein
MTRADDLSGRGLRANPLYELVPFERLGVAERRALAGLEQEPSFYGILRPRDAASGLGVKSADRETALLFLTLRDPGPLPAYVRRAFGQAGVQAVTRLVADGVLEIDGGEGYVSGAAALPWLRETPGELAVGRGWLAALSLTALRYAQDLAVDDPSVLAARLYGYNGWPLTPRWRRLLPSAEAARAWLGLGPDGPNLRRLERSWEPLPPSQGSRGWLHLVSRAAESSGVPDQSATYKLYVSPPPEALAESFGAILDALTAARPFQFKVGAGAAGLLRPDKIVAYFSGFEALASAADGVATRLAGIPAQGVPFTAEIGGDGLVSWGVDPPATERSAWGGRESWRFWLVQRLARALLAARSAREAAGLGAAEPWRFALERLRLEGIDTDTWTPGALLWKGD